MLLSKSIDLLFSFIHDIIFLIVGDKLKKNKKEFGLLNIIIVIIITSIVTSLTTGLIIYNNKNANDINNDNSLIEFVEAYK